MNRTDLLGSTAVMSDINSHSLKDNNKASFWKKTTKTVPGRLVFTSTTTTTTFPRLTAVCDGQCKHRNTPKYT